MKTFLVSILTLVILAGSVKSQTAPLRKIKNQAYKTGEVLEFRIHYGLIDAGEARLEIKEKTHTFQNRPTLHVVGTGRTLGAFDWFFRVRDRYETFIDREAIIPWVFIRRVDEGGYIINQDVTFDHYKHTATSAKLTIPVPENVQDILSAFYYARTLDYSHAQPGAVFPFSAYLDDEVFNMTIKYIGKETIKTRLGTFKCIKFRPMLLEGRVFKEEEDMTVWVSDDENRIVVRAEAKILVGSIKMDLKGYSGLANPLTSKTK